MADSPALLGTGDFQVDYSLDMEDGSKVRIVASASMLVTKRDNLDFILGTVERMRAFADKHGLELADDLDEDDLRDEDDDR